MVSATFHFAIIFLKISIVNFGLFRFSFFIFRPTFLYSYSFYLHIFRLTVFLIRHSYFGRRDLSPCGLLSGSASALPGRKSGAPRRDRWNHRQVRGLGSLKSIKIYVNMGWIYVNMWWWFVRLIEFHYFCNSHTQVYTEYSLIYWHYESNCQIIFQIRHNGFG